MQRWLILTCFTAATMALGCKNESSSNPMDQDMAQSAGGNGGMGGGGGGGGGGDMASGGAGDMGSLPDLSGLPAPDHDPKQHAPEPTMNMYQTASTFKAPVIYTVAWTGMTQTNGKDTGAVMQAFTDDMLKSDYWFNGVKEYGVGKGHAANLITLPDQVPAAIADTDLQSLVNNNLGKPGWPAKNDPNAIVQFIIDPKTTVSNGMAQGCREFGGYHSNSGGIFGGGTAYVVSVYCYKSGTTTPDFDNLTVAASHEAAETASDYTLRINRLVDGQGFPFLGGGEDGDLCLQLNSKQTWASGTYLVQRLFSNAIAMANNDDPCLPSDGPWFGASFDSGDAAKPGELTVTLTAGAGQGTFKILPFAYDAAVGPIAFYVPASLIPAGVTFEPDFAVGKTMAGTPAPGQVIWANPGSTVNMTVKIDPSYQKPIGFGQPTAIQLVIVARNQDKSRLNLWWADINAQ